ncbi:MAG: YdcF family protein, partial [Clostridia bacterium]|nr:YdcF family protein [Clostridia bacterium]
ILPADASGDGYDCILVLGCGVHGDTPSHMLEDRLLQGIALYHDGLSPKMIMSGDHGREHYDEVNVMKSFAVERGVASADVFMDHAGFSTYESMYRAKEVFQAEKILIVTQKYHLYRAVYDARALGLDAYGVASDPRTYAGQLYRDIREVLARSKDFVYSVFKPEPTYLGEAIPVSGNGDLTNDK